MGVVNEKWTAPVRERVRLMWERGESARFIADEIGAPSRSAVLGLIHRMGLSRPFEGSRPTKTGRPRKTPEQQTALTQRAEALRARPSAMKKIVQHRPPRAHTPQQLQAGRAERVAEGRAIIGGDCFAADATRVRLVDLRRTDCRWPLGDPASEGFRFCGDAQRAGSSYCAAHFQLSLPRERRAA